MSRHQRPRPNRAQTLNQLNDLLDLAHWIEHHIDEWIGPGSTSGGSRATGQSNPTEAAAMRALDKPDETERLLLAAKDFMSQVVSIEDTITDLRAAYIALRPLTLDQARIEVRVDNTERRGGTGPCQACGDWCTGVDPDRLKAGYCPRHYQRWVREDRPDRIEFQQRVKAETPAQAS